MVAPPTISQDIAPEALGLRSAVRRYLARRVPAAEVDDLLQEVYLNLSRFHPNGTIANISAYIFRVAANVIAAQGRRRRSPFTSDDTDDIHATGEVFAADRILISREELRLVMQDILALPERTRDVFMLHRFEQMSYPEIARAFGISVSAVEKHIIKALRRLTEASNGR